MKTKHGFESSAGKEAGGRWQGEAVEKATTGEAERKADRAEGNVAVGRHPERLAPNERIARAPGGDDAENEEEKREAAAEDHAADRAAGTGTAPRKI